MLTRALLNNDDDDFADRPGSSKRAQKLNLTATKKRKASSSYTEERHARRGAVDLNPQTLRFTVRQSPVTLKQSQGHGASHTEQRAPSGPSLCPMCGQDLAAVSDTELGRQAHVNGCLDSAAAACTSQQHPSHSNPAEHLDQAQAQLQHTLGCTNHHPGSSAPEDAATEPAAGPQQQTTTQGDIHSWLASLGLPQYLQCFQDAEVDADVVPHLTDNDLQEMGVADGSHRAAMLAAAASGTSSAAPTSASPADAAADDEDADDDAFWEDLPDDDELLAGIHLGSGRAQQDAQQQQQQHQQQEEQEQQPAVGAGTDADEGLLEEPCYEDWPQDWSCAQQQDWSGAAAATEQHHHQQQQQWGNPQQEEQEQQQPAAGQHLDRAAPRQQSNQPSSSSWPPSMFRGKPAASQGTKITAFFSSNAKGRQPLASLDNTAACSTTPAHQQLPPPAPPAPPAAPPPPLNKNTWLAASSMPKPQPTASVWHGFFPRNFPIWHTLPGTRMVVDKFGTSVAHIRSQTWILTHFHADHYGGLTKGWAKGRLVCTRTTGRLVQLKIKVAESKMLMLPLNTPTVIEGVTITLLDANHCPGAAMVVAEPPSARPVLHTGDARLTREATQGCAVLQRLRGKAVLVLDTTYCDPQYCFPSQQAVLQYTLQAVRAESFNPRTLFLFGTYTIGKERLFLEVAKAMGKKVYVSAAKRAVMDCLELSPEYRALITSNHLETNIHAVPLGKVSLQGLEQLVKQYKGRYSTVVGFQPTGWTHQKESASAKCGKRLQRGTVILHQVPYSEHSSFAELQEFVHWFRPVEVIPSVGNDRGPKLERMLAALRQPPQQRLSGYFGGR